MKLWAPRRVLTDIECEGRRFAPLETGGVLLGWRDGPDLIVADLIGPGPQALHGRHLFLPDHSWQVAQIRAAFAGTGGDLDYLGDWHTHPRGIATMSDLDRTTLTKLDRRVRGATMLIAGGEGDDWAFSAWTAVRGGLLRPTSFETCEIISFDSPDHWPRCSTVAAAD